LAKRQVGHSEGGVFHLNSTANDQSLSPGCPSNSLIVSSRTGVRYPFIPSLLDNLVDFIGPLGIRAERRVNITLI
jgi:hypothetical protein